MAVTIKAAALSLPRRGYPAQTVTLCGEAARECLRRAGLRPSDVRTLINTGVYREHNTFEPAIAAMIQKEAEINLDYLNADEPRAAFSFDLMNGAGGVLNAVQVAQALLAGADDDHVLITAGDVHPSGDADTDPAYPYTDLGAAFLLGRSDRDGVGFGPVMVREAPGPSPVAGFLATASMGTSGRERITVRREEGFDEVLLALAARTVEEYEEEHAVDLRRCLIVASTPVPGFGDRLAARLRLPSRAVMAVQPPPPRQGLAHTAAPVLGYLRAVEAPLPPGVEQFLFLTAGAGPSALCASYRPERDA